MKVSTKDRSQQRYDGNVRLISGCVATTPGGNVVLISSRRNSSFTLPKGGWEVNETAQEAASREAYEEAGLRGTITRTLGTFCFNSKAGCPCRLTAFAMDVHQMLESWPEDSSRTRCTVSISEALQLVTRDEQRAALQAAHIMLMHEPAT
jgi:diphosphoinositol-polyphosphate diphosphatase